MFTMLRALMEKKNSQQAEQVGNVNKEMRTVRKKGCTSKPL